MSPEDILTRIATGQGNRYLKEFLREKQLKIGKTKDDFESNLQEALQEGHITPEEISIWLSSVEGWGAQNTYIFEKPNIPSLNSSVELEALVAASDYANLLNADCSTVFPDDLTLSSIKTNTDHAIFVWLRDASNWQRTESKDYTKDENGETYEFRAYRRRAARISVRMIHWFGKNYCGLFIGAAKDSDVHKQSFREAQSLHVDLFDEAFPARTSLKNAIETLRHLTEGVSASKTVHHSTAGGTVTLDAPAHGGLQADSSVRQVGHAVVAANFPDADGVFDFLTPLDTKVRSLRFDISGNGGRLGVRSRTTQESMFGLLDFVMDNN